MGRYERLKTAQVCRLVGLREATFYYQSKRERADEPVKEAISKIIEKKTPWGRPRITHRLQKVMGFSDNKKRIERIYRSMGIQIGKRKVKSKARGRQFMLLTPKQANKVWAMDFVQDTLSNGRRFRCFVVKDICTMEAIKIEVDQSLPSHRIVRVLSDLIVKRGAKPDGIVCDNGPEFDSHAMDVWAHENQIEIQFIDPGKPYQNGFVESFNRLFRDECSAPRLNRTDA